MTDCANAPTSANLIPLSEAAKLSGYSMGHLRYLISRGLLEGWKLGRNYITTEEAIETYLRSNPRPGRKRTEPSWL
jgi:hypothetical protein